MGEIWTGQPNTGSRIGVPAKKEKMDHISLGFVTALNALKKKYRKITELSKHTYPPPLSNTIHGFLHNAKTTLYLSFGWERVMVRRYDAIFLLRTLAPELQPSS